MLYKLFGVPFSAMHRFIGPTFNEETMTMPPCSFVRVVSFRFFISSPFASSSPFVEPVLETALVWWRKKRIVSGGEVCGGSGWQVPRMATIGSFANLIAFIGQLLRTKCVLQMEHRLLSRQWLIRNEYCCSGQ